MRNPTRSIEQVKSVGTLVADLALRTVEAERRFINAAWWDEDGFLCACLAHGIAPARFADRRLGFVAWYLCECAEARTHPSESACLKLADGTHTVDLDRLDRGWFVRLIGEIDEPSSIDALGELVARLAGHREGVARAHLRGLAELCVDLDRYTVHIEERQQSLFVPARLSKGRARDSRIAV